MTNTNAGRAEPGSGHRWLQRLLGSRYALYALAIHGGVLLLLGHLVISSQKLPVVPFEILRPLIRDDPLPPPPPENLRSPDGSPAARAAGLAGKSLTELTRLTGSVVASVIASPGRDGLSVPVGRREPVAHPINSRGAIDSARIDPGALSGIKASFYSNVWVYSEPFVDRSRWRSRSGLPPATFTCYIGQYADGDWNCNPTAIENLMIQIVRWSGGRINASVQPEPLDLASDQIFKVKAPFIFITGHRDFRFTEAEVKNLREYLMVGGAIWADNSLPGRHSRFDEAFRSEMKRVLPDRAFEPLPADHPVFRAHFKLDGAPSGMNLYEEPIEQIRLHDELAVLYTLNAYSDLWETALNDRGQIDTETYLDEDTGRLYHKWGPHWGSYLTGFLYRNVNDRSIRESSQLGLNIVVHLLTRFDEKFRMLGKL